DSLITLQDCNPGASLPALGARVASGRFSPPDFTAAMARKDVRLMHEAAAASGIALRVTSQVAALQDEALARGEGEWDTAAAFRFPTV
ncbi:MAG: NAD-binding protein, partial [Gemmataceae bacterium]